MSQQPNQPLGVPQNTQGQQPVVDPQVAGQQAGQQPVQQGAPVQNAQGQQPVAGQQAAQAQPQQGAPSQAQQSGPIGQGVPDQSSGQQIKDPEQWATGDQPMTDAQRSYLDSLAKDAGETLPGNLTKAQASEHIDRLQAATGRGQNNQQA